MAAEHEGDVPNPARIWDNDRVRETIVLFLLAMTAVLTAWSGFEASKWGGEESLSYSQASAARVEAARAGGTANASRLADLTAWSVYVQATAQEDEQLRVFVEERFSDHFRVAYDAWIAQGRSTKGPFVMPEYVPPGTAEEAAADARADEAFDRALATNQISDDYTLLTVLFALVLFFASVSERLPRPAHRWALVGFAIAFLLIGIALLGMQPKLV